MRTLVQLRKYFKNNNILYPTNRKNYDSDYVFSLGGKKQRNYDSWYGWITNFSGGIKFIIDVGESEFCCGVTELGHFINGHQYPEHWKAFFEYVLLQEKLTYARTETITKPDTTQAIEQALKEIGFKLVVTIKSKHAAREFKDPKKQYLINVWDWIKPDVGKKS